ncbi:M83 protein [Murid betaherpesvirus 1]|nr:M83 protein [Murid betaherpesvirus 1]
MNAMNNRTEVINPLDSRTSSMVGSTKILLASFLQRVFFEPEELKVFSTGIKILLKRPSVLCVCRDEGMMVPFQENKKRFLHTMFYAVNTQFGIGSLPVPAQNSQPRKQTRMLRSNKYLGFCVFALALDHVPAPPMLIARVNSVKVDASAVRQASVSATTTRTGMKTVRMTVHKVRWANDPDSKRFKKAIVSLELPRARAATLDPKTCSDPHVNFYQMTAQRNSPTIYLTLRYAKANGTPPDSLTAILAVGNRAKKVNLKRSLDPFLKPLPVNGFRVVMPRTVQLRTGQSVVLTSTTMYHASNHAALFIPYLIPGLDIHPSVWMPNSNLSFTITGMKDMEVSVETAIGELRFVSRSWMTVETNSRHARHTCSQTEVINYGPEVFRKHKGTPSRLRDLPDTTLPLPIQDLEQDNASSQDEASSSDAEEEEEDEEDDEDDDDDDDDDEDDGTENPNGMDDENESSNEDAEPERQAPPQQQRQPSPRANRPAEEDEDAAVFAGEIDPDAEDDDAAVFAGEIDPDADADADAMDVGGPAGDENADEDDDEEEDEDDDDDDDDEDGSNNEEDDDGMRQPRQPNGGSRDGRRRGLGGNPFYRNLVRAATRDAMGAAVAVDDYGVEDEDVYDEQGRLILRREEDEEPEPRPNRPAEFGNRRDEAAEEEERTPDPEAIALFLQREPVRISFQEHYYSHGRQVNPLVSPSTALNMNCTKTGLSKREMVMQHKKDLQQFNLDKELKLILFPLSVCLDETVLAPFLFIIPPTQFYPSKEPFNFTFLAKTRPTYRLSQLTGQEIPGAGFKHEEKSDRVRRLLRS